VSVDAMPGQGDSKSREEAFAELSAMILDRDVPPQRIAALLDALPNALRPEVVRCLGPAAQKALYAKAKGFASVGLVDLVPPDRGDLEQVRHLGRNTLPAFRIFEKRFCRLEGTSAEAPDALAGYNFQTMSPITGPGYFVARDDAGQGEVLVDYCRLPTSRPPDWPEIRSNERGLSRFVYGFMVDTLRRVSEHVTIGSAARKGRDMNSYFVLSRAD
jgi:hypothetical protein